MSKIGRQPIQIPEGVEVNIDGQIINIKGPKGKLQKTLNPNINIKIKNKEIILDVNRHEKYVKALWGLSRALIANMIKGVKDGFEKKLEIQGVGYAAQVQGRKLILNVGFSHKVEIEAPEGIEFKVERNIITVSGIDNQLVGQLAADIRRVKVPEPYKGKGIRYAGEEVRRKVGKKAIAEEGATGS